MVTITINGNKINISDAQAYAISLILCDYSAEHALAETDDKMLKDVHCMFARATLSLSDCDRREIFKATICRRADGTIMHFAHFDDTCIHGIPNFEGRTI